MEIKHKNFKIKFSNSFLLEEISNREYETSYLNAFKVKEGQVKIKKDSFNKLHCYQNLADGLNDYFSLLDIFGGVGITAKIFDKGDSYVNEIDPNLLDILKQNFKPEKVFNKRIEDFDSKTKFDLVIADYNNFTIKKYLSKGYKKTLKTCFSLAKKYVILNDSSIFFLKYGKSSYNIYSKLLVEKIETPVDMFLAEKIMFEADFPGWKMNRIEYFNNSSIILFSKEEKELIKINKLDSYKEIIQLSL